jgi:hypothetical protein
MKKRVVTTASGAVYEEELSDVTAEVEVPGVTIAMVNHPFTQIQPAKSFLHDSIADPQIGVRVLI